jgi:hypothetical protein
MEKRPGRPGQAGHRRPGKAMPTFTQLPPGVWRVVDKLARQELQSISRTTALLVEEALKARKLLK